MRENLVIVNYMRTNPTIVDDLINSFSQHFKSITLINRKTKNKEYPNIENIKNLKIIEVSSFVRFFLLFITPFSIFFNGQMMRDFGILIKEKKSKFSDFKFLLKYYYVTYQIYFTLKKLSLNKELAKKTTIMSLWFTGESNAIAMLKRKYPEIRAVTMAHAHEIENNSNNNRLIFIGKREAHIYLDKILFISKNKLDSYNKSVIEKYGLPSNNVKVLYWGSKKTFFPTVTLSGKNIIVSCSTVEPLKRVLNIAEAVSKIDDSQLEWHHFGDGQEMTSLVQHVNHLNNESKTKCILHGRIENDRIKKFYYENNCLLFINFSTTEGIPISVMEAQSYGIPCLVPNIGGLSEIISDGINGYVISPNISTNDLYKKIQAHINLSADKHKTMSKQSLEAWESKFNLDNNIKDYLSELVDEK